MTTKTIFPKPNKQRHSTAHHVTETEVKSQQPIIPMNKVSLDVIKKLQTQPYPQLNLATHSTINDALQLYYNEYLRLYKQNQNLNDELASVLLERNNLADQFNQIKKMKSYDDNIRRRRRYASQIQRNYHCPMPKCNKGYGSEGSLTHHVRLKHPKFFESGEYEIYLETYILPKQEIKNEGEQAKMIDVDQEYVSKRLTGVGQKNNGGKTKEKVQAEKKQAKKQEAEQDCMIVTGTPSKAKNNTNSAQIVCNQINGSPRIPTQSQIVKQADSFINLSQSLYQSIINSPKQNGDKTD